MSKSWIPCYTCFFRERFPSLFMIRRQLGNNESRKKGYSSKFCTFFSSLYISLTKIQSRFSKKPFTVLVLQLTSSIKLLHQHDFKQNVYQETSVKAVTLDFTAFSNISLYSCQIWYTQLAPVSRNSLVSSLQAKPPVFSFSGFRVNSLYGTIVITLESVVILT